ncbi:MAG: hypothetical protein CL608_17640 [Anaerolineaceae bacterium]|nr:hypothetical protein [Anaerolineaceae bacterium]
METLPEQERDLNPPVTKRRRWWLVVVAVLLLAIVAGGVVVRQLETRHWEAGQAAIGEGEWDTAVTEFTNLLQLWPPFIRQHTVEATALRGVAYYHNDDLAAALADFAATLLADPNQVDIVAYQADAFFQQADYEASKAGAETALTQAGMLPEHLQAQLNANLALLSAELLADDERETAVAAALALANYLPEETVAELHTLSAEFALADPEPEEALAAIDRALTVAAELTPTQQARLLPEKAALLAVGGHWPTALAVSEEALALTDELTDGELAALHQLRSRIYFAQGDLDSAVTEAEAALELDDTLAWPHAVLAWQAYRTFDYETALAEAETALAQDETIALAYTVKGGVLTWQGKVHEALAELELALTHDPADVEAMALRVFNLRQISAEAEAASLAETAVALQPEAPAVLWAQAMVAADNQDQPLAFAMINQAIALDDGRPEFYQFRSLHYPSVGDRDKMAADLETSLALNPDFALGIMSQALFRADRYDFTDLEEISQHALEQWPDWYGSQLLSGLYYEFVVRDKEQALAAYDQVIELLPEHASNYLPRAFLYLDLGDYEKAQADFETSLQLNDQTGSAYYGLASIASANDDLATQRDYLEQALAASNNGLGERFDMALYLLRANEFDRAWEIANEMLAEDPASANAYAIRAIVHQIEGNNRRALADVDKALDLNPQFVFAYFVRADVLLANEEYEEAIEAAEIVLEFEPEAHDAHRLMFYAAYGLDDLTEAERQYELWLDLKPDFIDEYQTQGDMELTLGRYEDAAATFSAGLADDETAELAEWLLYSRAYAYLSLEDEAKYRADFEQLLGTATIIDLISDAEYWLAADKGLLVAVDGLATYTDESLGFQISYPAEWQRPLLSPEDDYEFLAFQELPDGIIVVNLITIPGVFGLTLNDVVPIISENVSQTEGLTILQTQYGEIGGARAFIQDYELILQDGLGNDEVYLGRQYIIVRNGNVWFFTAEASGPDFEPILPLIEQIMASIQFLP